jgi:mannose-6-phosphate isomerase-like protein (cupin superfamily)
MKLIQRAETPTFELPGLQVVGLAAPRCGATETCMWKIRLSPGAPPVPHSVTREEIFVGLTGRARATVDGVASELGPGDVLVVPAHRRFSLESLSEEPFEAMVAFPVGGQAVTDDAAFTPPWAE